MIAFDHAIALQKSLREGGRPHMDPGFFAGEACHMVRPLRTAGKSCLKAGQLQSPDQLLCSVNVGGCMLNFIAIPISDLF